MTYAIRQRLYQLVTLAAILFLAFIVAGCVTTRTAYQCQSGPAPQSISAFADSLSNCIDQASRSADL